MNIQDIAKSREKKAVFQMVLEESCRQWCDGIENTPERKDGEGFTDFFYGDAAVRLTPGLRCPVPQTAERLLRRLFVFFKKDRQSRKIRYNRR